LQSDNVHQAALQHYLCRVREAAQRPGASRLAHYFCRVRPSCLNVDGYSPAAYVTEVRERQQRLALAELRSGVHWGAEERGRLVGMPREHLRTLSGTRTARHDRGYQSHSLSLCVVR